MAYLSGTNPDEIEIDVKVILPDSFAELKSRADHQRQQAAELQAACAAKEVVDKWLEGRV